MWYEYLIIGILLIFSAYFSASDMVYGSVDIKRLQKEAKKGKKTAPIAIKLVDNYERSISTILFGNNLVNILASSIIAIIGVRINPDFGASIGAIIYTIILIIIAEFLPKAIAKRYNFKLALAFAYPTTFFVYLFFIFVWPISKLFELISKLFKKRSLEEDKVDEEVLDQMVDDIENSGEIEEDEAEIVRGAIDLSDIEAFEIMTPRVDVFAIDIDENITNIISNKEIFDYSRVPVYEGTIDNIVGILPVKSVSRSILLNEDINIKKMMIKPIYIPRNTQVLDLLEQFKKSRVHMAIVIDEYGGVEGVITMEDILEEIVGDIFDETDEIEEEYIVQNKRTWIIDGSMNIEDFFELIDYKEEFETSYSTVAGFCQEFQEGFLKVGDKFKFANYKVEVIEADELAVQKIKVTKTKKMTHK